MRFLSLSLLGLVLSTRIAGAVPVWEEAAAKARNATITCAPGSECSPSVGLLSFTTPSEANQCTASLVAPDIIATNGHCVPEDLRKAGASCAGRMWMNFLPAEGLESQLECAEVIFVQKKVRDKAEEDADYAFLRMKAPSARPYFQLSRGGFADEEILKFERVSPVKVADGVAGVQDVVSCRAVQHSLLAPFFVRSEAPVGLLADCAPVYGNSGSPILGADGTIRGVIHAKEGFTAGYLARKGIKLADGLAKHGFATNYACLEIPGLLAAAPAAHCAGVQPDPTAGRNRSFALLEAGTTKVLEAQVSTCSWKRPRFYRDLFLYEPIRLRAEGSCAEPISLKIEADKYVRVFSVSQ